ncbi:MAG TPA: hypothetical protein GX507_09755 [Clostridia bacterium]|nr:hypothetical protein [Clostridia bacterium]
MPIGNILKTFADIISHLEVLRFEVEGDDSALQLVITFNDGSKLYARDYIFGAQKRKYSYHWQDKKGALLVRWDNAPHWPEIETHPHHKHVHFGNNVLASYETDLIEVLAAIRALIKG